MRKKREGYTKRIGSRRKKIMKSQDKSKNEKEEEKEKTKN